MQCTMRPIGSRSGLSRRMLTLTWRTLTEEKTTWRKLSPYTAVGFITARRWMPVPNPGHRASLTSALNPNIVRSFRSGCGSITAGMWAGRAGAPCFLFLPVSPHKQRLGAWERRRGGRMCLTRTCAPGSLSRLVSLCLHFRPFLSPLPARLLITPVRDRYRLMARVWMLLSPSMCNRMETPSSQVLPQTQPLSCYTNPHSAGKHHVTPSLHHPCVCY